MAEAKWSGVLSTTEPRNDVGIIKVRQGNVNSEVAEFQIVQNNKPYNLTGLTVYFCASFGLNLVEKPAVIVNAAGGRIQYTFDDDSMQSLGRQKGYFSIKKEESKIDSTQDFEYQVESSLMTRSIDGKSYIYKLSALIKILDDFVKNGQKNFNTWFDSVKEILYGVDPGGNILRELIEARKNSSGNIFTSLKERLDKNEDETNRQLAQMAINVKNHGAVGDWNGVSGTDNLPAFNAAAEALPPSGGYILIPPDEHGGDYMLSNQLRIMKSNVRIIVAAGATIRTVGDQELIVFDDNSEGAEPTLVNCGVIGGGRLYTAKGFARNPIGFVRVKGCYVDGVIVGSGHKGVTAQEYNEDINFSNIHIEYADTAGITLESGINGAMIDKITIDECGKGVHVTGGDVGATGVSIDNVNIKKGTGDGIHCSKVVDLSMGDNIIANVDGRGIVTDNCTKIQENDNILKNIGQHGIANLNPSGELHADSNQLTNVGLAAPNTYDGFYTSGATQKYTYSNNDLAGTAHRAAVNNANMVAGLGIFRGNKLERGLSDNPNMYYGWTPYFIDDIVNGVKLYLENGLRTLKGVSAPTSGPWIKGDKIVNTTHSAVKNINEWVCNSSGTPGAWIARGLGSGPSSIRPTDLTQNDTGYAYFDTTLKKTIVWSGSNWIE